MNTRLQRQPSLRDSPADRLVPALKRRAILGSPFGTANGVRTRIKNAHISVRFRFRFEGLDQDFAEKIP